MKDEKKVSNTTSNDDVELTISVPYSVSAQNTIPLSVRVVNTGDEAIKYIQYPYLSGFKVSIWKMKGQYKGEVPLTRWGESWMKFPVGNIYRVPGIASLDPNSKLELTIPLHRYFDLSIGGSYECQVEWYGANIEDNPKLIIKSEKIRIFIKDE
ncbi:hypothetical protein [Rubritalea halochordaticola]